MPRILLVHTVRTLVSDFDHRVRKAIASAEPFHLLDEALLERIRLRGHVAAEDTQRLESHLAVGVEIGVRVALVTCSTLSQCAKQIAKIGALKVLTIDEAMVDAILDFHGSMVVLATNPTTVEPTQRSLATRARETGKSSEAVVQVIADAFAALQRGDQEAHDEMVRASVRDCLRQYERVALAQASMAHATERLTEDQRKRVLTSPDLAIERLSGLLKESDEMQLRSESTLAGSYL